MDSSTIAPKRPHALASAQCSMCAGGQCLEYATSPNSTFCSRQRALAAIENAAQIPEKYRGDWSYRKITKTYGVPFDDLSKFIQWLRCEPRLLFAQDVDIAIAVLKRCFDHKWSQHSMKRFWYIETPFALRDAREFGVDNNLPDHLINTSVMLFNRIDRVETFAMTFLENILAARAVRGNVTIFTIGVPSKVATLSEELQDILVHRSHMIGAGGRGEVVTNDCH